MTDTIPPTDPRDQLISALDPQNAVDRGVAVTIAHDLPTDSALVLAELVHKAVRRGVAEAYDRGWHDHADGTG
jgi:hypothetical protein